MPRRPGKASPPDPAPSPKDVSGQDLTPHLSHPLGGSAPRRLPQRLTPVGPVGSPKHPSPRCRRGFPTRPNPFTKRQSGQDLTPHFSHPLGGSAPRRLPNRLSV